MRPIQKGPSPYTSISDYKMALPYLEAHFGSYCSYCGFPITHVPEVEHVVSKSKVPERITDWDNLLLGCKYCNSRKSAHITLQNVDDYLWPDKYNTALAFQYPYGVPQVNKNALQLLDKTGATAEKAENTLALIKLIPEDGKNDKRAKQRNVAYQEALKSRDRWKQLPFPDMRDEIVSHAIATGFFSIWMTVFEDEPEILNALIDAFPGTEKAYFDREGHPRQVLSKEADLVKV